jgi:cytochrome c553
MHKSCAVGLLLALAGLQSHAADDPDVKRFASQTCATCHGQRGVSTSPAFPHLAGQQPTYIEAQLKGFKDHSRGDPGAQAYMWGMASQLDDETIKRLAAYYGAQTPARASTVDKALAARGKTLYENGLPEDGVPACMACHGPNAEGKEGVPRLAGQHAPYLVKQLAYFKSLQRGNAPVMHAIGDKLTFEQMQAVAAFAASK